MGEKAARHTEALEIFYACYSGDGRKTAPNA